MLRFSSRHVKAFTIRNRNELLPSRSFSISWHRFCSPSSESPSESAADRRETDFERFSNKSKNKVAQATQVMAQIADLKRSKSISEKDYKSDSRFENMMKVLESDIVAKAEPLVLIKGLKVEKR